MSFSENVAPGSTIVLLSRSAPRWMFFTRSSPALCRVVKVETCSLIPSDWAHAVSWAGATSVTVALIVRVPARISSPTLARSI